MQYIIMTMLLKSPDIMVIDCIISWHHFVLFLLFQALWSVLSVAMCCQFLTMFLCDLSISPVCMMCSADTYLQSHLHAPLLLFCYLIPVTSVFLSVVFHTSGCLFRLLFLMSQLCWKFFCLIFCQLGCHLRRRATQERRHDEPMLA